MKTVTKNFKTFFSENAIELLNAILVQYNFQLQREEETLSLVSNGTIMKTLQLSDIEDKNILSSIKDLPLLNMNVTEAKDEELGQYNHYDMVFPIPNKSQNNANKKRNSAPSNFHITIDCESQLDPSLNRLSIYMLSQSIPKYPFLLSVSQHTLTAKNDNSILIYHSLPEKTSVFQLMIIQYHKNINHGSGFINKQNIKIFH